MKDRELLRRLVEGLNSWIPVRDEYPWWIEKPLVAAETELGRTIEDRRAEAEREFEAWYQALTATESGAWRAENHKSHLRSWLASRGLEPER